MESLLLAPALHPSVTVRIERQTEEHRPREQRFARVLLQETIAECFGAKEYFPAFDEEGRPCWKGGICWSITHKFPWIAVAVSKYPVGIDLEMLVERDTALFSFFSREEWEILGSCDWLRFYMLWTAKEAVIKQERCTIDALRDIRLTGFAESKLLLAYHGRRIAVQPTVTDAYVCSLASLHDAM